MIEAHKMKTLNLETVMSERFSRYAKSIIQARALPDDRDGLKPVDRRILYAMWKDGNTFSKPYRKSAKAVGNVMGNFHPHGDSSIYGALIYMSQNWKMRIPLIDLHGNNGSIDGDSPAAMRYTEARTAKISNEMLRGINNDTVDWTLNFDDTEYEPILLPARFPNLLVNGATGISSGYATNIPPHNLGEVIDALIYLQMNPDATLDELMQFIKGPDFPTGGIIQGLANLKKAYATGRGKILVRSRVHMKNLKGNRKEIYVTEIPYGVNKLRLVRSINSIRINKKINGIAKVLDESGRQGLGIAIELKHNADAKGILNYLYKNTDLQIAYHFNDVAIDHQTPRRLSLKEMLVAYLQYQRQIVYNQTKYNLKTTEKHQEIVKGYIKALSILTDVIKIVRHSNSRWDASQKLIKRFNFTRRQANFIVALRLYRLTNTDADALRAENKVLNLKQSYYKSILNNPLKLDLVLRHDFLRIKKEYNTPRRTSVQAHVQKLHVSKKVTIPKEDVVVLISHDGFMKRSSWRSFKASSTKENGLKRNDYPIYMQKLNTREYLFMFTNKGHLIYRPVYNISDAKWKQTGQHISQDIGLAPDERIIAVHSINSRKDKGRFLMETNDGYIKASKVSEIQPKGNFMKHAPTYMKMKTAKSLVLNVFYLPYKLPNVNILLFSRNGFVERMRLGNVPTIGKNASGVKSINLKSNDEVSNVQISFDSDEVGILNNKDYFKRIKVSDIKLNKRNRRGIHALPDMKHHKFSIVSAIILNPNHNCPIKVRTLREQVYDITPNEHKLGKLQDTGDKIIKHHNLGIPVSMKYIRQ